MNMILAMATSGAGFQSEIPEFQPENTTKQCTHAQHHRTSHNAMA